MTSSSSAKRVRETSSSSSQEADAPQSRTILLYGDSLTEFALGTPRCHAPSTPALRVAFSDQGPGWGDMLAGLFIRRLHVMNRGFAGYNTDWAVQYQVPPDVSTFNEGQLATCELVTLWFGANDAVRPDKEQHVPLDRFTTNLRTLVNRALLIAKRVVVFTAPPIHSGKYLAWRRSTWFPENSNITDDTVLMDRSTELVTPYVQKTLQVCDMFPKDRVVVVDVFSLILGKEDVLLSDGLHFTAAGEGVVFKALVECIHKTWPTMMVNADPVTGNFGNSASTCELFPPRLKWWDQINHVDYRSSFADAVDAAEHRIQCHIDQSRPCMVLLGDSITQQATGWLSGTLPGWGDCLAAEFARRADVFNCGLSGYNSRWALCGWAAIAPDSLLTRDVELVTIFFGANDAADATLCPKQHVPLSEYERNIGELIRRTRQEWRAKRIVVIGPGPIHKDKYLAWRRNRVENQHKADGELLDRSTEMALQYSRAAQRAAKKEKAGFVDVMSAFMALENDLQHLLSDGLHFSGRGNAIVYQSLRTVLAMPEFDLGVLPDPITGKRAALGSKCRALHPCLPWKEALVEKIQRMKKGGGGGDVVTG